MKIVADLHTHTVASNDGFSTAEENILAARERGLELIGITHQGPALPFAPHRAHFEVMPFLFPEEAHGTV